MADVVFSPDGARFAAGDYNSTPNESSEVAIHSSTDGVLLMSYPLKDTVGGIDWSPDGEWVATADYSGAVHLLDTATGQAHLLGRHKVQAVLAMFSPGSDWL